MVHLAARAGVRNFYCTLNVDPVSIRALQGEGEGEAQAALHQHIRDLAHFPPLFPLLLGLLNSPPLLSEPPLLLI